MGLCNEPKSITNNEHKLVNGRYSINRPELHSVDKNVFLFALKKKTLSFNYKGKINKKHTILEPPLNCLILYHFDGLMP